MKDLAKVVCEPLSNFCEKYLGISLTKAQKFMLDNIEKVQSCSPMFRRLRIRDLNYETLNELMKAIYSNSEALEKEDFK